MKRLCPLDFFCEYFPTRVDSRHPTHELGGYSALHHYTVVDKWYRHNEYRAFHEYSTKDAMLACTLDS